MATFINVTTPNGGGGEVEEFKCLRLNLTFNTVFVAHTATDMHVSHTH